MNFTVPTFFSQPVRPDRSIISFRCDKMQSYARRKKRTRVLTGYSRQLIFEPSTRTRVSFGIAFNLLGGEVRETTGMEAQRLPKASLSTTPPALSSYSDVIAMRHPKSGSVKEFAVVGYRSLMVVTVLMSI